jgi:DNA-directed RNA polymerase subunit M/transcription elongation factor TFIIS
MTATMTEETLVCKECGSSMYRLSGSIESIFVCPGCGFSADVEYREQQDLSQQKGSQEKKVLIKNLFTNQFMKKYTRFPTLSEFLEGCGFVKLEESLLAYQEISKIPKRKWDVYIRKNTCFQTWDQMFEKAVELYLKL